MTEELAKRMIELLEEMNRKLETANRTLNRIDFNVRAAQGVFTEDELLPGLEGLNREKTD